MVAGRRKPVLVEDGVPGKVLHDLDPRGDAHTAPLEDPPWGIFGAVELRELAKQPEVPGGGALPEEKGVPCLEVRCCVATKSAAACVTSRSMSRVVSARQGGAQEARFSRNELVDF